MAGKLRTQRSLLALWQSRFKSSVRQYLQALDNLNTLPDDADDDAYAALKDKERLLRGRVRGQAELLIILSRPFQASDKVAIADLEIDYGMPGERSKPRPGPSPTFSKWFAEYWGTNADE